MILSKALKRSNYSMIPCDHSRRHRYATKTAHSEWQMKKIKFNIYFIYGRENSQPKVSIFIYFFAENERNWTLIKSHFRSPNSKASSRCERLYCAPVRCLFQFHHSSNAWQGVRPMSGVFSYNNRPLWWPTRQHVFRTYVCVVSAALWVIFH